MARQYQLKTFLRYTDKDLLAKYFQHKNIAFTLPAKQPEETELQLWERAINNLPLKDVEEAERDFRDINEMTTEDGIMALLDQARRERVALHTEIEQISNVYDQAIHTFIHHPAIFQLASVVHYIDDLKAKAERLGLPKRPAAEVIEKKAALTNAVREYLISQDGRGQNCQVDVFPYEDRVCFIAYPEDYAKPDLHFEGGELKRSTRRPCFQIVFVYYPSSGKLELSVKGGNKRQLQLFSLFNTAVLEDDSPILKNQKVYNLNQFLDPNFILQPDIQDQIEYVRLKALRLVNKYDTKRRITLEVNDKGATQPMQDLIEALHIERREYNITQAVIKMKFPGEGNKGSVTIQLTFPDKCNLNDSPLHRKAKGYLKKWKLEYGFEPQETT